MANPENPYSQPVDQMNPYAPAVISSVNSDAGSPSEQVRKKYLAHEASVKSVGVLYLLGGTLGFIFGVAMLISAFWGDGGFPSAFIAVPILVLLLSALQFATAIGLRKLAPWSRIGGCILSGIGLLSFPVGTLINGYILYLFLCAKGKTVFTPEYKKVVEETPHLKYKTSIVIWVLLGILVVIVVLGVIAAIFAG